MELVASLPAFPAPSSAAWLNAVRRPTGATGPAVDPPPPLLGDGNVSMACSRGSSSGTSDSSSNTSKSDCGVHHVSGGQAISITEIATRAVSKRSNDSAVIAANHAAEHDAGAPPRQHGNSACSMEGTQGLAARLPSDDEQKQQATACGSKSQPAEGSAASQPATNAGAHSKSSALDPAAAAAVDAVQDAAGAPRNAAGCGSSGDGSSGAGGAVGGAEGCSIYSCGSCVGVLVCSDAAALKAHHQHASAESQQKCEALQSGELDVQKGPDTPAVSTGRQQSGFDHTSSCSSTRSHLDEGTPADAPSRSKHKDTPTAARGSQQAAVTGSSIYDVAAPDQLEPAAMFGKPLPALPASGCKRTKASWPTVGVVVEELRVVLTELQACRAQLMAERRGARRLSG